MTYNFVAYKPRQAKYVMLLHYTHVFFDKSILGVY